MKRKVSIRVRDRTDDGQAGVFIEEVVADDEGPGGGLYVKI